jgi:imidazolonepropionase-like amidohydrolase
MRLLAAIALLLACAPAAAQTAPEGFTVIHAGTVLDRPGRPPRRSASILVRGGKIEAVQDGFVTPAGAAVIDLRDRFVLPGLIDSHVHLASDTGGEAGFIEEVRSSPGTMSLRAAYNGRKTLDAGFTTVRNLGDFSGATLALRDAVQEGWVPGPRIVDAGDSIGTTGGHMDMTPAYDERFHSVLPQENLCDGVESCRQAVRRQIRRRVDVIKIATTGGVNSGTGLLRHTFDDETRALIETAHLYGRKVAVHAHGAEGIAAAVAAGADSIEHGTMLDDATLAAMKRSGTYYVPTLSTVNGYVERLQANRNAYRPDVLKQIEWRIGITGKALQRAVPAGVKIAFGTDAGVSKHGRNADEFELMVKHGMTPASAIQAATVNAADLLGLGNEIGTLEPGKAADVIAVAGDPLTDVTVLKRVGFVMKGGKVHKDQR